MSNVKTLVVGIAGGTGSGKTTIARKLVETIDAAQIAFIPQDAYYQSQDDIPSEMRALTNYDEPSAFDTDLLIAQLDALLSGEVIARPVYDFAKHNRATEILSIAPKPVIILEGILVLYDARLCERMTLKVFVDAPSDERFIRRLERDVKERGRSAESVIDQYRRTVKPMHDLFVKPTIANADLIVPEGASNRIALEVLQAYIRAFIDRAGHD